MRRASSMFPISVLGLCVWAVGNPGCSSDAALKMDSGTSTADAPVVMNCGDTSQPIDPTALIDDMEAPDYQAARAGGRAGAWWAGGDKVSPGAAIQPDGNADAESIPGGRCGSQYAMHVTGHGFSMWAVLSVSMGWGSLDGGADALLPHDDSFRTGITFWARIGDTSTDQVRLAISDKYSRPEGGYCTPDGAMDVACYDTFGVDLTQLSTAWRQYRIPFGGLTQRNFGLHRPSLDAT
jgi:hypothetical protein